MRENGISFSATTLSQEEGWGFDLVDLEGIDSIFSGSEDKPSRLLYYTYVGSEFETIHEKSEPYVPHAQNFYGFIGPLTVNTVERTWLIRKPALETIYVEPANKGRMLLKFSPAGLYDAATEAWAGTDLNGIQDFFYSGTTLPTNRCQLLL